jgi:hypothetical protein
MFHNWNLNKYGTMYSRKIHAVSDKLNKRTKQRNWFFDKRIEILRWRTVIDV